MSLMYAKESAIMSILKDVEEDHKRTQEMNLGGSNVWKSKSVQMTNNLCDALQTNTRLTALNLSACMLNDALRQLVAIVRGGTARSGVAEGAQQEGLVY